MVCRAAYGDPTAANQSAKGMTELNFLPEFLHSFLMQLPVLLMCLAAVAVVLGKWRQAPRASLWALLGFGLALILCFAIPIGQVAMRSKWPIHWRYFQHSHKPFALVVRAFGMRPAISALGLRMPG